MWFLEGDVVGCCKGTLGPLQLPPDAAKAIHDGVAVGSKHAIVVSLSDNVDGWGR